MAEFDCKKMKKNLGVLDQAISDADSKLSEMEDVFKWSRSSRSKAALKKMRAALKAAQKVGSRAELPVDVCVAVGEAFDETRSAFEAETKDLHSRCKNLSKAEMQAYGDVDYARTMCHAKVERSNLPRAMKKVFDMGEDGMIQKSFFKWLQNALSADMKKARKKIV